MFGGQGRLVAVPTRFTPGIIDYNDMSARYLSGRALSEEAAKTWTAALAPFVSDSARPTILDLGAGTGRFAAIFAMSFDATIIGIEPSAGMLAEAARRDRPTNLIYLAGTAEQIPLADARCDLAWMSHVWHHVRDHQACASELRRVLRPGNHLLVRGTFGDRLDGFPTLFEFWPATRAICEQLPRLQETIDIFEANGFTLAQHRRVQQATAPPASANSPAGLSPVPIPRWHLSRTPSSVMGRRRSKRRLPTKCAPAPSSRRSNSWCSAR
jgi:SAM-dependent methyltransferase